MDTHDQLQVLTPRGLQHFVSLQADAATAVTRRFYTTHGSHYARYGERGHEACREDLAFHLEFLRPVLEFGLLQPMVDYLCWLDSVLAGRGIPTEHLTQSLDCLGEYFAQAMEPEDGAVVVAAILAARTKFGQSRKLALIAPELPEAWPRSAAFEAALLTGDQ
ncbi:MAG TPA: hypothetical protein PLB25_12110, partial [Rhodoferax sp.]|nr:hypothetical protein [Rhodoferax sp.]